jgi:hypothetical protein
VGGARHFCGDCGERLASQIGIVAIPGDVTLELGAKAVVALADGDLRRNPEGPAQPGIAEFGQPGLAAELA